MAKDEVIELIKRYVHLLNMSGIPIKMAFLYGSYSRNEANEDSDIDVMLVSELFDSDDIQIKAKAWQLTEQIDLRIEPYTIGVKKYLHDDVSPLLQAIRLEGIEIFSA